MKEQGRTQLNMETNKHEGIGLDTIKRREWKGIERIEMEWLEVK